jgi:outer membrane receptor protein involved in Fe transport
MHEAERRRRSGFRSAVAKRRLLEAAAVGALMLPGAAWGQAAATLPEVTVTAPRPAPTPPRRVARGTTKPAQTPPAGAAPPATTALPAFQVIAPAPITGLGFDRNKVPAMVQTVTSEDFSRVYSPNVVETLQQRIPGVITNNVQGNEFATDLRYRGFSASPVQGTPQGSPSICKACASTRPLATPSTGT